jgi:sugar lactone lactonase YvrE
MSALLRSLLCSVLLGAGVVNLASAFDAPEVLLEWGSRGLNNGEFSDINGIAVDAVGNVFVADRHRVQKFTADGVFVTRQGGVFSSSQEGQFRGATGLAVDGEGNVYVADWGNNRVQKFDNDLRFVRSIGSHGTGDGQFVEPTDVVIDGHGNLGVVSHYKVQKFTPDGTFLTSWSLPEGTYWPELNLAQDIQGNIYVADRNGQVQKYSSDGTLLSKFGSLDGDFPITGIAVDGNDQVYLSGSGAGVFDQDGTTLATWDERSGYGAISLDALGNVFVGDSSRDRIAKYGPVPKLDRGEPTPGKVFLHVAAPQADPSCSDLLSLNPSAVVTSAQARSDGTAQYYVYLLAASQVRLPSVDNTSTPGLTGLQLGIEYSSDGLKVLAWQSCGNLEFPNPDWPGPGSGNTITWGKGDCHEEPLVTAGYFHVTSYSPSILDVVGFPATGLVKVANCEGAEGIADVPLDMANVGWISFGGAAVGGDRDGCNPLRESCLRVTPVQRTTWGRLKTRFAGP